MAAATALMQSTPAFLLTREKLGQYLDKDLVQALWEKNWSAFETRMQAVHKGDNKPMQVLFFAIVFGAPTSLVQNLLETKMVDVNECIQLGVLPTYPLREALFVNDLQTFKLLLENGANANMRPAFHGGIGPSILDYACGMVEYRDAGGVFNLHSGIVKPDAIRLLVKHGCRLEDESEGLCTALALSCLFPTQIEATKVLVEMGANVNHLNKKKPRSYPLLVALSRENLVAARLLLEHGADVHMRFGAKQTPLIRHVLDFKQPLSWKTKTKMCRLLFEFGLKVDEGFPYVGDTLAYVLAKPNPHLGLVKCLLENRCLIGTAVFSASYMQSFAAMQLLLQAGADPNSNHSGSNSVLAAMASFCTNLDENAMRTLKLLIWAGADVDYITPAGDNRALHMMTANGFHAVVKLLLQAGADRSLLVHGVTPMHLTMKNGDKEMMQLLSGETTCGKFDFVHEMDFVICAACRKLRNSQVLHPCGGCEMVAYCNIECQRAHWKEHKPVCKMKREMAAKRASLPWNQ